MLVTCANDDKEIDAMVNWSTAKDGVVAEVLRDSEIFLSGTVTIATSADQRAAVVAGTFATAGAAIVAGIIGFAAAASAENTYAPAVYAGACPQRFYSSLAPSSVSVRQCLSDFICREQSQADGKTM
jgi:hypothetical protein